VGVGRNHSTSFTTGTRPVGSINAYASISIFVSILVPIFVVVNPRPDLRLDPRRSLSFLLATLRRIPLPENLTGSSQPIRIVRFINRKAPQIRKRLHTVAKARFWKCPGTLSRLYQPSCRIRDLAAVCGTGRSVRTVAREGRLARGVLIPLGGRSISHLGNRC
jgi:hypothetical protein